MSKYLTWDQKIITSFDDDTINTAYNSGYVFTRLGKGIMHQTRSVRIDLSKFELTSENRRILKKNSKLQVTNYKLPYSAYGWFIGKMGKDFYETKFGDGTFSANKIKELMTDIEESNFNLVFVYSVNDEKIGYCIVRETNELLHYSYPFYELSAIGSELSDLGLGMMLNTILYAQKHGKKYIYLGSAQRSTDTYKLQFKGLEWWDGKKWQTNLTKLKDELK